MDQARVDSSIQELQAAYEVCIASGYDLAASRIKRSMEFVREVAQIAQLHVDVDVAITWTCANCGKLQAVGVHKAGAAKHDMMRCGDCGHVSGDFFLHYRKG